jgi:hypothetical protein
MGRGVAASLHRFGRPIVWLDLEPAQVSSIIGGKTSTMRCSAVFIALALFGATSSADAQWLEAKGAHYSIFYQAGYEQDVAFTRTQLDQAEALMKSKYGVSPSAYHISFYLHPAPTQTADVNRAQNRCCTRRDAGIQTGTIDYLAPSSPAWNAPHLKTSLGLPKDDDFHAKVMMSEYIPIGHYAVQDARTSGGWRYYSAPEWFVQGLQEYDAIFHTTDTNREVTAKRLLEWARNNPTKFGCCSPNLAITDVYNGGATFVAFLAAQFGEDIHARLLRNTASTFDAALADETKLSSVPDLFDRFRMWLDSTASGQPNTVVR